MLRFYAPGLILIFSGVQNCFGQETNDTISKPITITTIENDTYKLGAKSDYIYVVNFWFIGCAPCRNEIPLLNELATSYSKKQKIKFIAISISDDEEALRFFKGRTRFDYESVALGKAISKEMTVNLYPTNFVIDRDGRIVYRHAGFNINISKDIKDAIDRLL